MSLSQDHQRCYIMETWSMVLVVFNQLSRRCNVKQKRSNFYLSSRSSELGSFSPSGGPNLYNAAEALQHPQHLRKVLFVLLHDLVVHSIHADTQESGFFVEDSGHFCVPEESPDSLAGAEGAATRSGYEVEGYVWVCRIGDMSGGVRRRRLFCRWWLRLLWYGWWFSLL